MNPAVLTWALAQPSGSRAAALAIAYTSGALRVTFDGRTTEYRSLAELAQALSVLHATQVSESNRRPARTLVSFSRGTGA